MKKIIANEKSVKQLLQGVRYGIDFYQREYAWQRRHVEELLNDFASRFFDEYDSDHETFQVGQYRHYFLGTIITIEESGQRFIVDGQQRLTTLTLLLIYIHHLRRSTRGIPDVTQLIYSDNFGVMSFNLDIPERVICMEELYNHGRFEATEQHGLSVRNLAERYEELEELFDERLTGRALSHFVYWLIECVDFVEIEAPTDDDAFTIFETMNDRGVNLSQVDMLKGFLLANINSNDANKMHQLKSEANGIWRKIMRDLADLDTAADEDFFKTWLRAKYAESIRPGQKGASNQDFENIDKFHRWTRDKREQIGLAKTQDYYDFIARKMNRFADYYRNIHRKSLSLHMGLEALRYNHHNNFTLQYMLELAPIRLEDDEGTAWQKIRLVADFADIFLARRMVNFKRNGQTTLRYTMFNLAKEIRNKDVDALREILLGRLDRMEETFHAVTHGGFTPYRLNNFSGRAIRYLLARMTAWVEQQCGMHTNYHTYTNRQDGKPFELEHVLADDFERHRDQFAGQDDFQRMRNYFGGLALLPRGTNQSLGAMPYEEKVKHYVKENLLAASLHSHTYQNNPNFTNFVKRSGLPFQPHEYFNTNVLMQRQELYRQLCEQIWSPDRLLADN